MLESNKKPHLLRQALIGVAIVAVFVFAAWYLTSPNFNAYVRVRLVTRLEQLTGGRVELKALRWNLSKLEIDVSDLTIHGNEPAGTPPYIHVDHASARVRIGYVFRPDIALRSLRLDRPAIHIIVYPDGATSQPGPKLTTESPVETIFKLRVDRADIRDGEFVVNNRRTPLDFSANEIVANLRYARRDGRYDGEINAGKMDAKFKDLRPLAATAEMQFSLWPNTLRVTTLRLRSGHSEIEASGEIKDFSQPDITAVYKAKLDVGELAPVARRAEFRRGVLSLDGRGRWSAAEVSSAGKLLLRDFEYRDSTLRVANAEAAADFSVDHDRFTLAHVIGKLLGGNVTGEVAIINWSGRPGASMEAAAQKSRGTKKTGPAGRESGATAKLRQAPELEGLARLQLRGLRVADLAAAVSSRAMPLEELNLAGTADGAVDATWRGAPASLVAAVVLDVAPPASPAPQQNPVTARLRGVYRAAGQTLEMAELNLATRATRLSATGALGLSSAKLNVTLNTTDLNEFRPVLQAQGTKQMPVEVHGRASFTGTLSGKLAAPTVAGHLQVTDFDSLLAPVRSDSHPLPGTRASSDRRDVARYGSASAAQKPGAGARRMHWDQLFADIEYSPQHLAARNAVLRRGSAQVNFDFAANLSKGSFTETSPLTAKLNLRNAPMEDVQALAGYNYPISGTLNFNVRVSGTMAAPSANGSLRMDDAMIYGEPVQHLTAYIQVANREVQLNSIELAHKNGARISGSAGYNLTTTAFQFDLQGTKFNLARVQQLQTARRSVAGTMNFSAQGSGTKEAPSLNLHLQLRDLVLNGERAGDLDADALTTGELMRIVARSHFEQSNLTLNGTVRLREDYPAELVAQFSHMDFDPLLRAYMGGHITGHSQIAGTVTLRGPLRRPRDLNVAGDLGQVSLNVENIEIHNDGPIRFTVAQEVLNLERLHLIGDNTDLKASGTVQLSGTRTVDVAADGHVNLRLLQSVNPEVVSYGTVTLNVKLGGAIARPAVEGSLKIANAGLSYVDLPNGLSGINGTLIFNRDRLQIQELTARTGGGALDITGYLTYTASRTLRWSLKARGRDTRLRYPAGVSSVANTDLQLQGTFASSLLSGDVVVTKLGMDPRFDFALYLARAKQPPEAPNPKSLLNNLRLDVHIVSTPELQVQTSLAKLSGTADLRLRGTAMRPAVLGRVNIIEGNVIFNGTKYQLERGDVTFTNPVRIAPVLDMQATTRIRDYDITLGFHGPTDKLATTYRSDPPLATADIIALLAFGRTREESAVQTINSQNFNETASQAILGQALSAAMGSRMQKLFGVSRIKIDPRIGGAENNPSGARVTVEQQVANKLTLTYITDLARSNQQVIQAEYNINRNVSVVAIRDQNGVVSVDVRYRQRKR